MTENKRYFKKEYDEEFYILDSEVISEKDFEEKLDYQGYRAFEDSLTTDEIVGLLNENEQLKQQVNCHKSRIQLLSPLLDLADTIIDLSDDEKAKAFWEKRNNEVEQEWNKILKGDVK